MASPKQKTRFAILGLLSWQPMSGYDLKKMIDMGLQHFWNESYGQLYPTLEQLVADGHTTCKKDAGSGGRSRHVYAITAKGRREFLTWLREPTAPARIRSEPQLKFFLTGRLPAAEGIRLVEEYRGQLQEQYDRYVDSEKVLRQAVRSGILPEEIAGLAGGPGESNQPLTLLLSLRHGVLLVEARLAWCDEALKALRARRRQQAARKTEGK